MRKSAVDDPHVNTLGVHGLKRGSGLVLSLADRLVDMLGGFIEIFLGLDHFSGLCPWGDHLPLYIPVREIGRTPAQVAGFLIAVSLVEILLIHLTVFNNVEIAVHYMKA